MSSNAYAEGTDEARAHAAQHAAVARAADLSCMQLLAERTRAADEFASCPDVACAGSVVDVDAETIDTVPVIVQHQFAPFLGSRTWASVTGGPLRLAWLASRALAHRVAVSACAKVDVLTAAHSIRARMRRQACRPFLLRQW